jgi:hypothetical protein
MKIITRLITILVFFVVVLIPSWAAKTDQIPFADFSNENAISARSPYSEPTTMIIFGISLIGLAWLSRKNLKK